MDVNGIVVYLLVREEQINMQMDKHNSYYKGADEDWAYLRGSLHEVKTLRESIERLQKKEVQRYE